MSVLTVYLTIINILNVSTIYLTTINIQLVTHFEIKHVCFVLQACYLCVLQYIKHQLVNT